MNEDRHAPADSGEAPNSPIALESITPYGNSQNKREQITQAFDMIAHRYDRLNRILSFGIDRCWRRRSIRHLREAAPAHVLDVATGTADLAIMTARATPQTLVTGIDLSEGMLRIGQNKISRARLDDRVNLVLGDCLALPFPDATFEAATVAFGVRNFENISVGLSELCRVLKPQGIIVILELSRPEREPARSLFRFYLNTLMPFIGRHLSGHDREYRYLPASVAKVPQGDKMLALLRAAGFVACRFERYTFGACTCYTGQKPA